MLRTLSTCALAFAATAPSLAQTPLQVSAAPGSLGAFSSTGRWAAGAPDTSVLFSERSVGLWSATGNWIDFGTRDRFAIGVSAAGDVILVNADTTQPLIFSDEIWVAGQGWQQVPGPASRNAVALSDDGRVVVGHDLDPFGALTVGSYTWNRVTGTLTTLRASDPAHLVIQGVDITADGRTVMGYSGLDVVIWDEFGSPTVIIPSGGSSTILPRTISADGSFVVGARRTNGVCTPFIWSAANGVVDLPALGPSGIPTNGSTATGVSADGQQVIGSHVDTSDPLQFIVETFIWTPSGGAERLSDWLSNQIGSSTFLGNGSLAQMSDDGERFAQQNLWIDIDATVGTNYCSQQLNSTGQVGRMGATGSVFVEANDLTLTAENLSLNQFGIFIVGDASAFGVTGGPMLCIGGTIGRFQRPGEVVMTGSNGRMSLPVDLTSIPLGPNTVSILAGDTWYFEAWHREPQGTTSLTDGLEITFE